MQSAPSNKDNVFDRWAWLYTLCRERLFTDHTELVARLMGERPPTESTPIFVELGCGPGFYSVGMAKRFPNWQVMGVDQSTRLLKLAMDRVATSGVSNCRFTLGDATELLPLTEKADFLLASRLLFILADRQSALVAMHERLRPGGMLLIAEPRPGWRSRVALLSLAVLKLLSHGLSNLRATLGDLRAVSDQELSRLVLPLEWQNVRLWSDARYHYVLCRREPDEPALAAGYVNAGTSETSDSTGRRQVA